MATLNLTTAFLHLASDLSDYVAFPEAASSITRGTRSEVRTYSDETRRVVSSPADQRSISINIPAVAAETVTELEKYIDQVVLFRSPTGEYQYAQLLNVRRRHTARQSDKILAGASLGLEPVSYGGLI